MNFFRFSDGVEASLGSHNKGVQTPDVNIMNPSCMRVLPEDELTCDPNEIQLHERGSTSTAVGHSNAYDNVYISERITVGDNFMVLHCDTRYLFKQQ